MVVFGIRTADLMLFTVLSILMLSDVVVCIVSFACVCSINHIGFVK